MDVPSDSSLTSRREVEVRTGSVEGGQVESSARKLALVETRAAVWVEATNVCASRSESTVDSVQEAPKTTCVSSISDVLNEILFASDILPLLLRSVLAPSCSFGVR